MNRILLIVLDSCGCGGFADIPGSLQAAQTGPHAQKIFWFCSWIRTIVLIDFADICEGFADIPAPLSAAQAHTYNRICCVFNLGPYQLEALLMFF